MKKALITGASSGIGSVFVRELAGQGYDVTCVARSEEKLQGLTKELGDSHRYIRADLTDANDLAAICQELSDSKYNLLVNNAGYGIYDHFGNIPLEKVHHLIRLNVSALVDLSHAFLKSASSGDALINVSSALSLLPYPGGAVYSATKAFVTNFTEALWYEYKDQGIYVMALLPGVTDTNFHHVAMAQRDYQAPSGPSYPPEVVVKEALAALQKRKSSTLISGPKYRFLTALATRLMSRAQMISMMGKGSAGL
ncbi:MAG: SDR family NAD(P)-dependent oxidoreductase [Desulfocapsaceae bacterium]|nr:SDR family NAD(P)-dependent oxidoreductase [Desulfocapsaceae bacterium]